MKKCMRCGELRIANPNHDLCFECWKEKVVKDEMTLKEEHFKNSLFLDKIHTVYVMFYTNSNRIGYTNDLDSRFIEIKREFPNNRLVYFREFITETDARRFEAWLKEITERQLNKFVSEFQNKLKKVECF